MKIYFQDAEKFEVLRQGYGFPAHEEVEIDFNGEMELEAIINYAYSKVSAHFIGKFYMGEKRFKEYMGFYLSTYLHYKNMNLQHPPVNLEEYYKCLASERIFELNIGTKRTLERRWKEFNQLNHIYNKYHDFKYKDIKNQEGHHIAVEQVEELQFMLENYDDPTVKKIRNGKFGKITFEQFDAYVQMAREEIESSTNNFKNIRHYKFERRTHYELFKELITLIEKYEYDIDENKELIMKMIFLLQQIPDVKHLNRYTKLFFELDRNDYGKFMLEIEHLATRTYTLLIGYGIYIVEGFTLEKQLQLAKDNEKNLMSIYNLKDYFVTLPMTKSHQEIGNKLIKLWDIKKCRGEVN